MFDRRHKVLIRPELDDEPLHRTITATRPVQQMHGLGAGGGTAVWTPVAKLLRETAADWDRRAHRVSVLARTLPAAVVDAWATRNPQDRDMLTVRAYVQVVRAGRADNLAALHTAEAACAQAALAVPDDPTPWIALLSLFRSHRIPVGHAWPVWDEAVRRDPWNRTAHHEMLRCLSPRASGTSAFEMKDFADHRAAIAAPGSPMAVLPLAARAEYYAHRVSTMGRDAPALSGHWHGPAVARETDAALERWFRVRTTARPHAQAIADLNILAFALTMTQRTREAEPVFHRVGRHMTPFPWSTTADPLRTFTFWSSRARRGEADVRR
ncbi:MAG: hypothetical protein JF587_11275 [Catenulisporales bacterium]|nr:hypothetical protein [Catenulisporales bacterium]